MRPLALSGIICLGAGVMNIIPWGGPTARAFAALHVDSSQLFTPVLPAMIVGVLWAGFCAYLIGRNERKRLGLTSGQTLEGIDLEIPLSEEDKAIRRPHLFWFNLIFTLIVIVALILPGCRWPSSLCSALPSHCP